jgi:hypothetical protein
MDDNAGIFAAFLASNLKGWRSMQDIFDHAPKAMETRITYFHLGVPYLATIFYVNGNEDIPWLDIRLCNPGCRPPRASRKAQYDAWGPMLSQCQVIVVE